MNTNAFECPKCKRYTRHIEIGFRESTAIEMKHDKTNGFLKGITAAFSTVGDITGTYKFIRSVLGKKSWKCCECGFATMRNADGSIDAYISK